MMHETTMERTRPWTVPWIGVSRRGWGHAGLAAVLALAAAEIFRAPDINAALFFAFFMLTDPPTSPARYRDQVIYGIIVAIACAAFSFLPAGLLIGNGWEAWRRTRGRSSAATLRAG